MERIFTYFRTEMEKANDKLISLSVTTALHSNLVRDSTWQHDIEVSVVKDLFNHLCKVLTDAIKPSTGRAGSKGKEDSTKINDEDSLLCTMVLKCIFEMLKKSNCLRPVSQFSSLYLAIDALKSILYTKVNNPSDSSEPDGAGSAKHNVNLTKTDFRLMETALAVLSCFCRCESHVNKLVESGYLQLLPSLMSCADRHVVHQALLLATNMTRCLNHDSSNSFQELWTIMFSCLELLNNAIKDHNENRNDPNQRCDSDTSSESGFVSSSPELPSGSPDRPAGVNSQKILISAAMEVLANILHRNQSAKTVFHKKQGLETVLLCYSLFNKSFLVKQSTLRLLANFSHCNDDYRGRRGGIGRLDLNGAAVEGDNTSFDMGFDDGDDDNYTDSDSDALENKDFQDSLLNGVEGSSAYLVKGSSSSVVDDPKCELMEAMDPESLLTIICGMLNSGKKGLIYLGISKNGKVEGVKLSRDKRDQIRLGIDDITSRLVPHVIHLQVQIKFIPVTSSAVDNLQDLEQVEHFVIELECTPVSRMIYTKRNGDCCYRSRRKTIVVNEQDIRHLIVIDEEEKHRQEILHLKKKLEALRSSQDEE